jgi:hypothetical protein
MNLGADFVKYIIAPKFLLVSIRFNLFYNLRNPVMADRVFTPEFAHLAQEYGKPQYQPA